ncbi:MAG: hypothetical protein KGI75_31075 [Rhizobiaceae bacterium]|nr:hypothetical protein [Rhizobiaceae bacterium]
MAGAARHPSLTGVIIACAIFPDTRCNPRQIKNNNKEQSDEATSFFLQWTTIGDVFHRNIGADGRPCRRPHRWPSDASLKRTQNMTRQEQIQTHTPEKKFICRLSEKRDTVFREITTGDVDKRQERAALLKALRIERERPTRAQRTH